MEDVKVLITAKFLNVDSLEPNGGVDDPNLLYKFEVQCTSCNHISEWDPSVNLSKMVPNPFCGGDSVNLAKECSNCHKDGTIKMEPGHGTALRKEVANAGSYSPLMRFHFKNLRPLMCYFDKGWKVQAIEGTTFSNIDVSQNFITFCDRSTDFLVPLEVGISDFKAKMESHKLACAHCEFVCDLKEELKAHSVYHGCYRFECAGCWNCFSSKKTLGQHIKSVCKYR